METSDPLQLLLADLQGLQFSDYESRAYIALLKIQPATAYEVAKEAGLPKANGYSVLESLSRKEAVQPISESPARYVATPPEVLLQNIVETTERRCERVKQGLSKLGEIPQHEYVWSVTGAQAIDARIAQIIRAAKGHLWIKSAEQHLDRHRDLLEQAADRGVKILIVLFGTRADDFAYKGKITVLLHEGNGIPVAMAPYLITVTRDFEEALVAQFGAQPHGSYTRNRPLVNLADSLIRHEIYFSEIFAILGDEIGRHFGPALFSLREKYLPKEHVETLRQLVGR